MLIHACRHLQQHIFCTFGEPLDPANVLVPSQDKEHSRHRTQRNIGTHPSFGKNLRAWRSTKHPDRSRTRRSTRAGLGSVCQALHRALPRFAAAWTRLASSSGDRGRHVRAAAQGRHRLGTIPNCWKLSVGLNLPGARGEFWAYVRGERRLIVVRTDASGSERRPVIAQILEVGIPGHWGAVPAIYCIGPS